MFRGLEGHLNGYFSWWSGSKPDFFPEVKRAAQVALSVQSPRSKPAALPGICLYPRVNVCVYCMRGLLFLGVLSDALCVRFGVCV